MLGHFLFPELSHPKGLLWQARGFPAKPASIKECAARFRVHPDTACRLGRQVIRVDLDEADALFRPIPTVGSEAS
jgi:hypothetical protein